MRTSGPQVSKLRFYVDLPSGIMMTQVMLFNDINNDLYIARVRNPMADFCGEGFGGGMDAGFGDFCGGMDGGCGDFGGGMDTGHNIHSAEFIYLLVV